MKITKTRSILALTALLSFVAGALEELKRGRRNSREIHRI